MKIEEYLDGLASLHGKALNATAGRIFLNALRDYPQDLVLAALERCTRELKTFPTIADVLSRIDDGHPGVEEAWALVPKNEQDSAVWTGEIARAFWACVSLIDSDPVGARMAFKEKYSKELLEAKAAKRPPKWDATLGTDKEKRVRVIQAAVQERKFLPEYAQILLPDTSFQDPNILKQVTQQPGPSAIGALVPQITKQEKK